MLDIEVKVIREHIEHHSKNKKIHTFVKSEDFGNILKSFPSKICEKCGFEFRLGHFCEATKTQTWIPNWISLIKSSHKAFQKQWRKEQQKTKIQIRKAKRQSRKKNKSVKPKSVKTKSKKRSAIGYIFCIVFLMLLILGAVIIAENLQELIELFD